MLRDSGYCETASDTGGGKDMVAQTPFIPVPPVMDSEVREKDSKMSGSSCRALRHAVASLNRLDDFTCEKIGSGFFSEVFKVTHRVTGQVMVLKMNLLRSNRHNMLKEVQLMNQLCHKNILGFMGVCVHEGQLHALTEYINGGSLEQLIQNRSLEIPYTMRMKIALDIARGMEYLHSRDVFHRDLTSKNVLIKKNESNEDLSAVVGDFGLAAKIPRSGARLPTVGSPYWMSPECLKGQWYDERSDIFSYGIILCELIARIEADPDFLPRTENFGLDYLAFIELCTDPPPDFLKLAFSCCNFEPKNRPSFKAIVEELSVSLESNGRRTNARSMSCILPNNSIMPNSITARSEEFLPATSAQPTNPNRKLCHRRSLSEDVGMIVFPPHTAPSDKARCHLVSPRPTVNPLKHVGEAMVRNDPHYKPFPSKANPFAALGQFKGVKKILASTNSTDLFSSCFELPSPSPFRDKPFDLSQTGLKQDTKPYERGKMFDEESGNSKGSTEEAVFIEPVDKPSQVKSNYRLKSGACKESVKSKDAAHSSDLYESEHKLKSAGGIYRMESRFYPGLKAKPSSLPSSPTFSRRRSTLPILSSDMFTRYSSGKHHLSKSSCEYEPIQRVGSETTRKKASSLYAHPLFKNRAAAANPNPSNDETKTPPRSLLHPLRSCASSSNLAVLPDCSAVFQPGSTPVVPSLRRRGSCESGFFSSVGEDFCLPGIELVTASSVTLSSSSAASSLFLDSGATVSCSLDDIATPLRGHPHFNPHTHKRSSSIYTDSSEDVSSLGGGDLPTWDDRASLQGPQQISKIVEYFERKQAYDSMPSEPNDVPTPNLTQHYQLHREYYQLRRSYLHDARSSETSKVNSAGTKRGVTQRLMICEGAVRSKLQLFDKK